MPASRPRRWLPAAALALFAVAAAAAVAGEGGFGIERRLSPAQLAEIGLSPRQIELLDRYLSQAGAVAPPVERARYENTDGSARDPTSLVGLNDAPIRSRLKGRVDGWAPGTVFELENGQQWKVLKGQMRLRKPAESPEILVVPGIAGRWFLQVDPDLPKARVYRID